LTNTAAGRACKPDGLRILSSIVCIAGTLALPLVRARIGSWSHPRR
jgi:hypothetical protein